MTHGSLALFMQDYMLPLTACNASNANLTKLAYLLPLLARAGVVLGRQSTRCPAIQSLVHETKAILPFFSTYLNVKRVPGKSLSKSSSLTWIFTSAVFPGWRNHTQILQISCIFWKNYFCFMHLIRKTGPKRRLERRACNESQNNDTSL